MVKCRNCAYHNDALGRGKIGVDISCFRRGIVSIEENIDLYRDNERECADFYKKIPNVTPEETFKLQREEQSKGREFAYTEKSLELSSEANKIARDANKLSYDSRLLAWLAIIVSVLTFIATHYR